ncbi:hypothetical protein GALL_233160 [mine drainage metagenome]|uniref:Uncharacterized protein n=1 Tax=mine drainage metagenome TaxID=410659 RepID=A0A1J5RGW3_9ZZZZ
MSTVIELDDPTTWPTGLRSAVARTVTDARRAEPFPSDLHLTDTELWNIRDALDGHRVLLFHAARLLPGEIEDILAGGLQMLDERLIERKITEAASRDYITDSQARMLIAERAPLDGSAGRRAAQVCAIPSLRALDYGVHGVLPLMTQWGGEAIYRAHERDALGPLLRSLGQPAIVAFSAPALRATDLWFPRLEAVVVSISLGLVDANADVFLRSAVPASDIRGVWLLGMPEYDAHPILPRQ